MSFKVAAMLLVSASMAIATQWSRKTPVSFDPLDYKARTEYILRTTPLIDGHNDLPFLFRLQLRNQIYDQEFSFSNGLGSHTDLKRMRQGQVGGQFWSTFVEVRTALHVAIPWPRWH